MVKVDDVGGEVKGGVLAGEVVALMTCGAETDDVMKSIVSIVVFGTVLILALGVSAWVMADLEYRPVVGTDFESVASAAGLDTHVLSCCD